MQHLCRRMKSSPMSTSNLSFITSTFALNLASPISNSPEKKLIHIDVQNIHFQDFYRVVSQQFQSRDTSIISLLSLSLVTTLSLLWSVPSIAPYDRQILVLITHKNRFVRPFYRLLQFPKQFLALSCPSCARGELAERMRGPWTRFALLKRFYFIYFVVTNEANSFSCVVYWGESER